MTHTELIERLKADEGMSDILFIQIVRHLLPGDEKAQVRDRIFRLGSVGAYESACIGLAKEVLPGWLWEMHWNGEEHSVALVPSADVYEFELPKLTSHTDLCRAHLLATLQAIGEAG